ncbi:OadG family protein [Chloroflexota bacterium]
MGVDWGFSGLVGGVGFSMVFALLIILAVVIWLTGRIVNRTSSVRDENESTKEEV